ncbi:MAG: hypothetical protein ABFD46_09000 [Armatimonadota bacterium]
MLTASNETTKRSQEVAATSDGALRVDPSGSRYQDLGLVIDDTNVAAGAYIWSSYYENTQWVRNLVLMVKSDKQYRAVVVVKDTGGIANGDSNYDSLTIAVAASGSSYRLHRLGASTSIPGILGYAAKFGVKNEDSSAAATSVQLRIQLLGL